MRLTDDQLRDVLQRAEEIQSTSWSGGQMEAEMDAVIRAAEEVGLSRTAVVRALRERLDLPFRPPTPGELMFARSADGKFYVAEALSTTSDSVRVRFLRGGEHTVAFDEIRQCSFLPGERIVCPWPWWGPWNCEVLSYDEKGRRVKVSDGWGETLEFPISDVWLNPPKKSRFGETNRSRAYLKLVGWGAGAGGIIGSLVTWLLMR